MTKKEKLIKILEYSKAELQKADQKFGYLSTVISIFIALLSSFATYLSINFNLIIVLSVFVPLISFQVIALLISISGFWPNFVKGDGKSPFYFMDTIEATEDMIIEEFEEHIISTININSKLTLKKYKKIKWAIKFSLIIPLFFMKHDKV